MAKVGRPTKYKKRYCAELIEHMKGGLSYETFGAVIDVMTSTLYEWEKHPDFSEAKAKGVALCQIWWEKLARSGSAGGVKNFSAPMTVFNLKCRFPKTFREPLRVEHSGPDGKPIQTEDVSHKKLVAALAAALNGKSSDGFE